MSTRNLDQLMAPRSVVAIGASARAGSVGAALTRNLLAAGFHGDIHLVNVKGGEIEGRPVLKSLAELAHQIADDSRLLANLPFGSLKRALARIDVTLGESENPSPVGCAALGHDHGDLVAAYDHSPGGDLTRGGPLLAFRRRLRRHTA